ncbi:MAG: hypothetical protein ACPG05_03095 [Bdellovibrionales bacterium]
MKKFLCLLCLILFPSIALAQTPVTDRQAKIFYETCSKDSDPRITPQTQKTFCQCASFGYKKHMMVEDLQALAKGEGMEARQVMNKMIIKMYAPCMEFPVRDMVFQKCTKDAAQAGKKICGCMADKMSSYISQRAESELAGIIAQNPNVYDPLEAITSSKSYEDEEKRIVLDCIQGR